MVQHCWTNSDGEVVAAETAAAASQFHDVYLAGNTLNPDDWSQVPDEEVMEVIIQDAEDEEGTAVPDMPGCRLVTKTAREWAADYDHPFQVSSTNY